MAELSNSIGVQPETKVNILLVDDSPANLLSLHSLLEELGQNLIEAHSGEEAIERVKDEEFAVILLDVLMPGINGFDTARAIREQQRTRHTPIIFLTANDIDRAQQEEGYSLGAVDFLVKPILPVAIQAKVRGFVQLSQDRQHAIREGEQLRLLVQGTTEYAIFMLDPQGRVLTWNPGAERFKGYKAKEIIGKHFSTFYPKEAVDRGWPEHELKVATAEGRFEDEGWRVRKDGTQFWANVIITALKDAHGKLRGFSKITRDLTERKKSEENARRYIEETTARRVAEENARIVQEHRERLHVTLASIGDAVISTDAEGCVDFLNPVAEELTGWKNEDAVRQPLLDVFQIVNEDTRQSVENPAMRALKEGTIVGLANHTILISKDGRERPIDDSAAPIRDLNGNVIGSVLVFRDISEKKRAQVELRESEGRFRGLMEQAPFSIQIFSRDGRTLRVNRAWEELWGLTFDQIADYNILEDSQLEAKGILSYIKRAFQGEAVMIPAIQYDPNETLPNRTRYKDSKRWVSAVAYPLKDNTGQVLEVILVHQDITARREANEALRESEERLRLALEAGHMGVWDWNINTNKINWSDNLEELHGISPGTFSGNFDDFLQLVHPEERKSVNQAIEDAVGQGSEYDVEFRNVWPNGTVHWISGKGRVFGTDGKPQRMIGVSTDVTQRKRSEQTSRFLADASATLSVLVDFESTLQKVASLAVPYFADWAAIDLLEEDKTLRRIAVAHIDPTKVALAHELHRRFPPDQTAPQGAWNILRTGNAEIVSEISDEMLEKAVKETELLEIMRNLGLKSYIGVPLMVRGKAIGVITFISAESGHLYDLTDLAVAQDLANRGAIAIENNRLYSELRQADRRKDEFLATLAHELRNPLAPIRNSLQILKMPRVDPQMAQQTRDVMERQVHHLVRLVDDLLDVSRVMRGKIDLRRETIELATVIARAVETAKPLIEAQGHHLEINVSAESLPLDADPVRLSQVVGNLLTNAAKYTESGGHILLTARQEDNVAVLAVRDNGIGIAPDMLPHVFELFVQADQATTKAQGGLGIGLTLVKNLVEMHGGSVTALSAGLGRGSEFTIRLPLITKLPTKADEETSSIIPQPVTQSGHRILVVDDNHDAALSLSMLLRLQGHEVLVANNGIAALETATTFQPRLIFLDIGMPGMDGYEVARNVRNTPGLEKTVLAALTGWGQQEDRRRTAEAGFDHHLVKPPEPGAIKDILVSLPKQV